MDSFSLKTASAYVNNLLLSRGLLSNGKPIEFAKPSKAEGGTEATMAQIINVVHDLILRRDREQEQRESLVQTVRSLRTQTDRNDIATERLQTKCEDLTRQLSLCQSQERAARAALRTAEASARALREEVLRLKTTVQQVRTACANDVRKRDVQIQRLKTHLAAQQRGNKTGLVGASITITPGTTGMGACNAARDDRVPDLEDAEYSLKQETTEFLTQLSQSLSDENDNLISLVRSTLATLRGLQGMPDNSVKAPESNMSNNADDTERSASMVQTLPSSYEALAADMNSVLESLRSLLTNPNFVPIEEVSIREEEIAKLRDGFVKLETRWREAITLMNSWRERMEKDGDTVNLEELKMGLGLGVGFGASVYVAKGDDDSSRLSGIAEESAELGDLDFDSAAEVDVPEASPGALERWRAKTTAEALGGTRLSPPRGRHLREADGNGGSPKRVAFSRPGVPTPPSEENTSEVDLVKPSCGKASHENMGNGTSKQLASRLPRKVRFEDDFLAIHDTDINSHATTTTYMPPSLDTTSAFVDPLQALKRHSSPERHGSEADEEPRLTVQEKLNVARAEAEAAAAQRATKTRRVNGGEKKAVGRNNAGERETEAKTESPVKRTRVGGRPRRRKSTLTRDELADMLVGLI